MHIVRRGKKAQKMQLEGFKLLIAFSPSIYSQNSIPKGDGNRTLSMMQLPGGA